MAKGNSKQYSLFEEPHAESDGQHVTPKDNVKVSEMNLEQLYNFAADLGIYFPMAGDAIRTRARTYYAQKMAAIDGYLNASGLTPDTATAVKRDYLIALAGYYNFAANADQMAEALEKLHPYKAFLIDKYGFYRLLLKQYLIYARNAARYYNDVKDGDTETKRKYLDLFNAEPAPPIADRRGVAWALRKGIISLFDFKGIPTATVADFADRIRHEAEVYDYCNFYHLCKYAYLANPEELATIQKPNWFADDPQGDNITKAFCEGFEQELSDDAKIYAAALDGDLHPQEQEKARERAQEWNPTGTAEIIKQSKNLNAILQRPIEASRTRAPQYQTDTLPIKNHIEAFLLRPQNGKYNNGLITEDFLQRTIGGLDLMRSVYPSTVAKLDNNTVYIFSDINISEFAELCGMKDANQKEKTALFGCLMLLKEIYIRTNFPYRLKTKKGKKYPVGGEHYVQVANIPDYFLKDGRIDKFTIHLTANDLGRELMPITSETYLLLKKSAKGASERRFQAQLIGKDNKGENDLVDECFGFADMLKYAAPEELEKIKKYVQGHRKDAKKKVKAWFEKYKEMGVITSYKYRTNKAGDGVYKWERPNPKGIEEPAELITDAEIVDDEQGGTTNQPEQ